MTASSFCLLANNVHAGKSAGRRAQFLLVTAQVICLPQWIVAQDIRQASSPEKAPAGFKHMVVRTVDADGKPVPKARIYVAIWPEGLFKTSKTDYLTNENGQTTVLMPHPPRLVRIWTQKDGYVPLFTQWWPDRQPDGHLIPDEAEFELAAGTMIGGVVHDEDGNPIPDAIVEVMLANRFDEMGRKPCPSIWLAEVPGPGKNPCITDAKGRWSLNNVPAGDEIRVRVKLSHPEFIDDATWGSLQEEQAVTMEDFRAQTARIVMHRGPILTGKVTDARGRPVAGAVVIWGDDPYLQTGSQEVRTNEAGVYRFPPLRPGSYTITVVAKEWSPSMKTVDIQNRTEPADFQLTEGHLLQIRFIDSLGQPVPDVNVGIRQWRGKKSLYNHLHPNVLDTKIPVKANEKGIYQWLWAPEDKVQYSFYSPDFEVPDQELQADGTVHTVRMK